MQRMFVIQTILAFYSNKLLTGNKKNHTFEVISTATESSNMLEMCSSKGGFNYKHII
jgi:hypothetical protein